MKDSGGYYVYQSNSNRVLMLLIQDIYYPRKRQLLRPEDSNMKSAVQLILQVILGLPETVTRLSQKG